MVENAFSLFSLSVGLLEPTRGAQPEHSNSNTAAAAATQIVLLQSEGARKTPWHKMKSPRNVSRPVMQQRELLPIKKESAWKTSSLPPSLSFIPPLSFSLILSFRPLTLPSMCSTLRRFFWNKKSAGPSMKKKKGMEKPLGQQLKQQPQLETPRCHWKKLIRLSLSHSFSLIL